MTIDQRELAQMTLSEAERHIDYRAFGELIAVGVDDTGRYVVLVDNGGVQPYCVAAYCRGADERGSGRYYDTLSAAAQEFEQRTKSSVMTFKSGQY